MSASDPDDAWWARQPDVGDFIMDAGDAAGWSSSTGWFDPIDAELGCAVVADDDDQLDICEGRIESVLMHRRPWVSPLTEPPGCLVLFAGECAGDTLAWVHGGLVSGEDGGWWDGSEELIAVARRLRARLPGDPDVIPFVISMICGVVDDITASFADAYREQHGDQIGAVFVDS